MDSPSTGSGFTGQPHLQPAWHEVTPALLPLPANTTGKVASTIHEQYSLSSLFEAQVERTPDAVAVVYEQECLTYRELNRRANQLAHLLRQQGVGPEVLVGICMERSLEVMVGLLGIMKAGGAYVPLDPTYPSERLAYMLQDAQVAVLLTQQRLLDTLPVYQGIVFCLDTDWPDLVRQSNENPPGTTQPDNLAYMIYTSGSTGRPKGAMNTHRGICNRLLWMQDAYQLTSADRVLQKTPMSFDVSVWEFFWPLLVGACLVMARPGGHRDSAYLTRVIQEQQITTLHFVPSMLRVFLDEQAVEQCHSLRLVMCSGEALSFDLQETFFARLPAQLHNLYGPTEAAVDVTFWVCQRESDRSIVPIGHPIAQTDIYILDADFQPVPPGVAGELYIGGVNLARGYLNQPGLTAEKFLPHPFSPEPGQRVYRTGDLARFLPDGAIEYLGRIDNQLKLRGFRIEPGEIEAALEQHTGVQTAAVLAREDVLGEKRLVAYIVPDRQSAGPIRQRLHLEKEGLLTDQCWCVLPNGIEIVYQNKSEVDFLYREIFEEQAYFKHGITLNDGDIVFDVGANIGLFTLLVGQKCKNASVYAFEPVTPIFEKLRINTGLYHAHTQVFDYGLSHEPKSDTFVYYPHCSILSGRFADDTDREAVRAFLLTQQERETRDAPLSERELHDLLAQCLQSERLTREVRTLSSVIYEHNIPAIDLLKIDVEKSELDVLGGIQEEDWHKIRQIVVETEDSDGRLEKITSLLQQHGYRIAICKDSVLEKTNLFTIYAINASASDRQSTTLIDSQQEAASRGVRWNNANALLEDIRNALQQQLPDYMIPSAFVLLHALPLLPNGKMNRHALPAPERVRPQSEDTFVAPRTPLEKQLCTLWAESLGLERVGVNDDFFKLGGHSLLATRVISRLRDIFHVEIPLHHLFQTPTVAAIAGILEKEDHKQLSTLPFSFPLLLGERTDPLLLSYCEERVWFMQNLNPSNRSYHFQAMLRFTGTLHIEWLEQSLSEIVRRHEILRTTFPIVDGQPVQVIHPAQPVKVPLIQLCAFPVTQREAEAMQLIDEELRRPFDLTQLPLIRWTLVQVDVQNYILLHVEHHIIHDGWSFNVLLQELLALYRAFSAGKPSPLTEPLIQYADFSQWQRQYMQGEVAEQQLAYWKQRLAGSVPILALPTDRPRPARQTFRGAAPRVELPMHLYHSLKAFSRQQNVTLFMTMMAAFVTLLYRYSGQEDICVGTGIANRRWRETEGLIGMLVNNIVLRSHLSDGLTFQELLHQVRDRMLEAYANQDLPFDKVVEALQPKRDLSHNPLFQVMFSFHDSPLPSLELPGLSIQLTEGLSNGSAKFDLNLIVIARSEQRIGQHASAEADSATLLWEYNKDLFDEDTISRMVTHFQSILQQVIDHPEQSLSQVQLLSEKEQRKLLVDWNETAMDYPRELCLHHLFEQQVQRTPQHVAVVSGDEQLTYAELDRRANQFAHYLRAAGVGPDVPVGLCVDRSLDLMVALLGIIKAGGAYLPLSTEMPALRICQLLADAQAHLCIFQRSTSLHIPEDRAATIYIDDWATFAHFPTFPPNVPVLPDHLISIYYTSGSTGQPKGITNTHGGWVNRMVWMQQQYQLQPHETVLQKTMLTFDDAAVELFWPLTVGARVAMLEPDSHKDPQAILEATLRYQVAVLHFVPSMLALFVASVTPQVQAQLSYLRHVISSGEALRAELVRQFTERIGCGLYNQWGATEVSIDSTMYAYVLEAVEDGVQSVGRPIANNQVYILDAHLQPVPIGVGGDLYLAGVGLSRGYLNSPERTAEAFVPHPFEAGARMYKTGDRGRYRRDGNIEFLGRIDHQVKLRGNRIEPGEIEAVLTTHPAVREAAVLVREDDAGDKRLVAYVVFDTERQDASLTDLQLYLKERLPDYMVPVAWMDLAALPLLSSGKVDRLSLPMPENVRPELAEEFVAPRSPLEEQLATIWKEVLKLAQVGVYDDFFQIGGHSLLATQVVSRIRAALHIELPLRHLFEAPTIAELAALIERQQAEQDAMLAKLLSELEGMSDDEITAFLIEEK